MNLNFPCASTVLRRAPLRTQKTTLVSCVLKCDWLQAQPFPINDGGPSYSIRYSFIVCEGTSKKTVRAGKPDDRKKVQRLDMENSSWQHPALNFRVKGGTSPDSHMITCKVRTAKWREIKKIFYKSTTRCKFASCREGIMKNGHQV